MGGLGGTTSEQQYSLRWNDFHSSILSSFRHLRDQEDFVDVTLACDGCSFTAHKVVLSACSPYFRTLLKANPCQHPIVILRDVREQDMEALLRFMYNGEVHIGQEQLSDFLKTAQTLQVRGLADVPTKEQQKLLSSGGGSGGGGAMGLPVATSWGSERGGGGGSPGVGGLGGVGSDAGSPPLKRCRSNAELGGGGGGTPGGGPGSQLMGRFSPSPAAATGAAVSQNNTGSSGYHHSAGGGGDRESNTRESLLSQALESSHNNNMSINNNQVKGNSDSSVHAQSTGEESNSSDTGLSGGERGNGPHSLADLVKSEPADYTGGDQHHMVMDPSQRPSHNFPAALLGLQGLPGLLPGPSGMHNSGPDNSFVQRRGLDMMRVRATDPRPCPKCGKIYRSAHTLRTHLEDKHTVCPGYRCVLCGTVAKSRNSLHSHMSRQHRGISTKDLPVLPMPSPFDPELASRLLAKAGVKVSPAELRARSSPTGGPPRPRPDLRLDLKSPDDPEDLTMNSHHGGVASRFCAVDIRPLSPPLHHPQSPPHGGKPLTGSAILDTYLQFIAENSNLHLSAEQAAKMAGKLGEEQRRLALMDDRPMDDEGSEPEDDYSEEEREPQPIKAE